MIISKSLKSMMSLTDLTEVFNAINVIINGCERTRKENLEQIHALFAHYESVNVTTILELAL